MIRYNCFARSLAVIINRSFGNPVLTYFDDLGSLVPAPLGTLALWVVGDTRLTLGYPLKTSKSLVDATNIPRPLRIIPGPSDRPYTTHRTPSGEVAKWAQIILDQVTAGRITAKHMGN